MEPSYRDFLKKSKFNTKKAKTYLKAYKQIRETNLFNEEFYKENYPNVADSGMDPLTHYLFYGSNEGKYPSTNFNGNKYLNTYPETIKEDINPLVHYIIEGKEKGYEKFPINYNEKKEKILKNNLLYLHNYKFKEEPLVSIIILNRNGYHHLKRLFKNFNEKTNYTNYEIIVVDNASTDKSIEYLETLENIKLIKNNTNKSFSQANNEATKKAKGEYILLLNNDMEPTYGWLNELMGTILKDENIGAVGAKLIYPYYFDRISPEKSFTLQHATVKFEEVITPQYDYGPIHEDILEEDIFNQKYNQNKQCLAVTAAAVLIRKSIYEKLGGLDEKYFYGYEDVDFMLKLHKNNYKVIYSGASLLFHHESSTRNNEGEFLEINMKNIETLTEKWDNYLFKQILKDKIKKNKFFTNQTLTISIIDDDNKTNFNEISKLFKEFNKLNYNIELIPSPYYFKMTKNTDIILSFNTEYKIEKIQARKNIIKIYYTKEKISKEIKNYDIILTNNKENKELNKDNIFIIEDLSTETILKTIKEFYNIE